MLRSNLSAPPGLRGAEAAAEAGSHLWRRGARERNTGLERVVPARAVTKAHPRREEEQSSRLPLGSISTAAPAVRHRNLEEQHPPRLGAHAHAERGEGILAALA